MATQVSYCWQLRAGLRVAMRWFDARQESVWRAIARADPDARRQRYDLWDLRDSLFYHARVWWGGIAITAAACVAACCLQGPETIVTSRLGFEVAGEGARPGADAPALARQVSSALAALRPAPARLMALREAGWGLVDPDLRADRPAEVAIALSRLDQQYLVAVDDDGRGIVISVRHRDATAALHLDRALVNAVLASQPPPTAPSVADLPGLETRPALQASRARLASELDATDLRAAALSQSLTNLARDMVAALKATDNRSVSAEVSDKGAALLAELQLKRVQLASKYQDSYAPLVALDAEIAKLRNVVTGEQRRSSAVRGAANPVFSALASERQRVSAELDSLNTRRAGIRSQVATLDQQLAAQLSLMQVPHLVAGPPLIAAGTDPRLLSLPLMAVIGLTATLFLQWLRLRDRRQLVTPAEVELALGLPVLRCLDAKGVSLRLLERPALRLRGP